MQPWPVINLLCSDKSQHNWPFSVHYRVCVFPLRDHRRLYVGDARGRIFSWTVSDNSGKKVHVSVCVCRLLQPLKDK